MPLLQRASRWARSATFPLSRRRRGERIIAAGRVVLAGLSWLVLQLDLSELGDRRDLLSLLLGIYLAYAVLYLAAAWPTWRLPSWSGAATHALDLLSFSVLCLLSGDAASPLFVFFVFGLVSATIRWRWRGTFWTALTAIAAFGAMGLYAAGLPGAAPFALDQFLIRFSHLVVVAVLLGYLGRHQQQIELDLAKLARWPRAAHADLRQLVDSALKETAVIFGAEEVALLWQEHDEPAAHLAILGPHGALEWQRYPPGALEPWVPEPLAGRAFLSVGRGRDAASAYEQAGGLAYWRGEPLGAALLGRLSFRTTLGLPLVSGSVQGLLVVCDPPGASPDDLVTGQLVARIISAQLDQRALTRRLEREAADAERRRLGRELHDGVAQSLAAAAMQLEASGRLIAGAPEEAHRKVIEVLRQLEIDQRELREFANRTRSMLGGGRPLSRRLEELASRIECTWGTEVVLDLAPEVDRLLSDDLAADLCQLAYEAVGNAARHSGASRIEVAVECDSEQISLTVADNGHGFPFVGTRDLADLERNGEGPVSIRERVAERGGLLRLESQPSGARIEASFRLRAWAENDFDSHRFGR